MTFDQDQLAPFSNGIGFIDLACCAQGRKRGPKARDAARRIENEGVMQ
jgi:hypothetical protein